MARLKKRIRPKFKFVDFDLETKKYTLHEDELLNWVKTVTNITAELQSFFHQTGEIYITVDQADNQWANNPIILDVAYNQLQHHLSTLSFVDYVRDVTEDFDDPLMTLEIHLNNKPENINISDFEYLIIDLGQMVNETIYSNYIQHNYTDAEAKQLYKALGGLSRIYYDLQDEDELFETPEWDIINRILGQEQINEARLKKQLYHPSVLKIKQINSKITNEIIKETPIENLISRIMFGMDGEPFGLDWEAGSFGDILSFSDGDQTQNFAWWVSDRKHFDNYEIRAELICPANTILNTQFFYNLEIKYFENGFNDEDNQNDNYRFFHFEDYSETIYNKQDVLNSIYNFFWWVNYTLTTLNKNNQLNEARLKRTIKPIVYFAQYWRRNNDLSVFQVMSHTNSNTDKIKVYNKTNRGNRPPYQYYDLQTILDEAHPIFYYPDDAISQAVNKWRWDENNDPVAEGWEIFYRESPLFETDPENAKNFPYYLPNSQFLEIQKLDDGGILTDDAEAIELAKQYGFICDKFGTILGINSVNYVEQCEANKHMKIPSVFLAEARLKKKLKDMPNPEEYWQGVNSDLEISLFEYDFVMRQPKDRDYSDEWFVMYNYRGQGFDTGWIRESDLDGIMKGEAWLSEEDVAEILNIYGFANLDHWLKNPMVWKFWDLFGQYGPDNVIGSSFHLFDENEAREELKKWAKDTDYINEAKLKKKTIEESLKDNVYNFLNKEGKIWYINYQPRYAGAEQYDGPDTYIITIGDPYDQDGFIIEDATNSEYYTSRKHPDIINGKMKRGSYVRNNYIVSSIHMRALCKFTEAVLKPDQYTNKGEIKDINLTAELNDYIIDWFVENKSKFLSEARLKGKPKLKEQPWSNKITGDKVGFYNNDGQRVFEFEKFPSTWVYYTFDDDYDIANELGFLGDELNNEEAIELMNYLQHLPELNASDILFETRLKKQFKNLDEEFMILAVDVENYDGDNSEFIRLNKQVPEYKLDNIMKELSEYVIADIHPYQEYEHDDLYDEDRRVVVRIIPEDQNLYPNYDKVKQVFDRYTINYMLENYNYERNN